MKTATTVLKNTGILFAGRIISIAVGIVYVAALSRYIHAEGMGKIATATSLVSMLCLLVNFGLGQLIVRDVAGDRSKANAYFWNTLLIRAALSILFAFTLLLVIDLSDYPLDTMQIICVYAIPYVLDEFTNIVFSIFNAFEEMGYQAAIQTGRDLVNAALSLIAIYFHASLLGIVWMSVAATFLKFLAGMIVLRGKFFRPRLQLDFKFGWALLRNALPFTVIMVLTLVNNQVDIFLLSIYRAEEEVGWLSAALVLVNYLTLVPTVLSQAIFPVFSKFHHLSPAGLRESYRNFFKVLTLLGFPLCIGAMVTADPVILLVYGPGFENAALALRVLALMLFWMFGFANGNLLNATGGQNYMVFFGAVSVALNILTAVVLIPPFGFVGASFAAVESGLLFSFPITLLCHKRLEEKVPYGFLIKTLLASLGMGLAVMLTLQWYLNPFLAIFLAAPVSYFGLLLLLRAVSPSDLAMILRRFMNRKSAQAEDAETGSLFGN